MPFGIYHLVLPILGWHKVTYTDLEGVYVYDSIDSIEVETPEVTQYDRQALLASSGALNLTLNTIVGPHASLQDGAPNPQVRMTGLRTSADSPHIALAERIEVEGLVLSGAEGIGSVPYLLTEEAFDIAGYTLSEVEGLEGVEQAIIFAGTAADCITALNESDALAHLVFLRHWNEGDASDWIDWDSGEPQIAVERIRDALTLQVTRAFAPDLVSARERYYAIEALRKPTRAAESAVQDVLRWVERTSDAALCEHLPALEECAEILRALCDVVDERAAALARAARL